MEKGDLQCVLIGKNIKIYTDVTEILKGFETRFRFIQVSTTKVAVSNALKRLSGASIVFISDEVPFSLQLLSDLVWQYASDAIVVILTRKTQTTSLKIPFNNTQFSKLHFSHNSKETSLFLQFLIQSAQMKSEFRRCKSLLGISEKRCQWLVDSSREAIAFISRDLHLYANTTYLNMFHIDSVQELHSISVTDVIVEDEHQLFDSFQKNQAKNSDMYHSLILSMKKKNGAIFRANAYVIPSVYKGRKCFQLWVRSMGESNLTGTRDSQQIEGKSIQSCVPEAYETISADDKKASGQLSEKQQVANPFGVIFSDKSINATPSNSIKEKAREDRYNQASLLKGIIRRKEATLSTQKLSHLRVNEQKNGLFRSHFLLSLKVPIAQKKGIDDYLLNISGARSQEVSSIFWDKVKITRLFQMLLRKKHIKANLFIRLSEASIADKTFIAWLEPGLRRIRRYAANLIFMLPSQSDENQIKSTIILAKQLRKFDCKIAMDGFFVAHNSNTLLKQIIPDYVRLSLPWTRKIQGNQAREIALSSIIRQLESKNIKVIAPCDFSTEMKKLFILSGASFCQERTIKNA